MTEELKNYKVKVVYTLEKYIEVEAENKDEAESMIYESVYYNTSQIIKDPDEENLDCYAEEIPDYYLIKN
jgi:hypothetical protein